MYVQFADLPKGQSQSLRPGRCAHCSAESRSGGGVKGLLQDFQKKLRGLCFTPQMRTTGLSALGLSSVVQRTRFSDAPGKLSFLIIYI